MQLCHLYSDHCRTVTGLPPSHHYCIETVEPSGDNYCIDIVVLSFLLPHLFPLLCGVDVSYETPPFSPVLRVLPLQFPLRQIAPDAIHPPPLWTSSPSFSRHLHRHHSLAYVFVFSSRLNTCPYHFNLFSCTFLDISPTFVVPLILSFLILSSLVTPS